MHVLHVIYILQLLQIYGIINNKSLIIWYFMSNFTIRLPEELHKRLEALCLETDRQKSYYIKQALEEYLEEKEDYLIALGRLTKPSSVISLAEVEKTLGLDD